MVAERRLRAHPARIARCNLAARGRDHEGFPVVPEQIVVEVGRRVGDRVLAHHRHDAGALEPFLLGGENGERERPPGGTRPAQLQAHHHERLARKQIVPALVGEHRLVIDLYRLSVRREIQRALRARAPERERLGRVLLVTDSSFLISADRGVLRVEILTLQVAVAHEAAHVEPRHHLSRASRVGGVVRLDDLHPGEQAAMVQHRPAVALVAAQVLPVDHRTRVGCVELVERRSIIEGHPLDRGKCAAHVVMVLLIRDEA